LSNQRLRSPKAESAYRKRHGGDLYSGWPPSLEQQQMALKAIRDLETYYNETSHPAHAWRAYSEARNAGLEIPDWVHRYFQNVCANIEWLLQGDGEMKIVSGNKQASHAIRQPREREVAPALAAAFGFVPGGASATERKNHHARSEPGDRSGNSIGRWNPLVVDDPALLIAASVSLLLNEGCKLLHAYEDAATENKVSRRTVERAWKKHGHRFLTSP
jgi:hypothetical protein